MTPSLGFPRPVPRAAPPQFLSLESFQMTPELIAEIDQAHSLGAGMSGVAYAGGATSGPVSSGDRQSPREPTGGPAALQRRDTARDKDRETWERDRGRRAMPTQQPSPKLELERTDSPQYFLRSAAALPPSPPAPRQNVPYTEPMRSTPPSVAKLNTQSPTGQSVKARAPDKSLPVQEEFDEDGAYEQHAKQEPERDRWTPGGSDYGRHANRHDPEQHTTSSPTPSSDLLPEGFDARYDVRPERNGRENLVPHQRRMSEDANQRHDGDDDDEYSIPESYTPRSPSVTLPPERGLRDSPGHTQQRQHPQQAQTQPHIHSPSHEEHDHFLDDPAAAHTAAPSPSPLISGMGRANGVKPVLPPYSPAPPVGSPYPYPFGHIRRGQNYSGSYNPTMDFSQMDPNVVREQLALQMQIYALNNGGMVSDSTLSPSSTPFPGPQYNPWAFLQTSDVFGGRRGGGIPDSSASMRSSPSHQPVSLPPLLRPNRGLRRRERSQDLRHRAKVRPPPRVESTQPRDTSPELSSGEETAGESKVGEHRPERQHYAPRPARWDASADDEDEEDGDDGEWIDEDIGIESVTDDLLQLEFHTDYVGNLEKRRRRWKVRWEALLRSFHALDRETDTTLVLLAAPSHSGKLHSVASRAIRRDVELLDSPDMLNIRSAFAEVAARRRASRSSSLLEQLSRASSSPRDGSPSSSSDAREEDLRRALDTAIGSLRALEMRWIEEKHRLDDDKEKVQLLLKQVLGVGVVGNLVETAL
ncbi:hypothetical protein BJV77DRAFT_1007848 [Russula vinacea]|nr:hypothetical protein BJV77DRAFT_1007848 [Russula vinacea]